MTGRKQPLSQIRDDLNISFLDPGLSFPADRV